jgi:membrane associated rhomboid family serine protease
MGQQASGLRRSAMNLSPRLKWKLNRYTRQLRARLEGVQSFFQGMWSQQRMCPACRALVDRREKVCPLCNERMTRFKGGAMDRMLSAFAPEQSRYSVFLLSANVLLYVMTLIASMKAAGGGPGGMLGSIDGFTLVRFGAKYGVLIQLGEWWRFITPIFLHGSLLHLGMNCWVLYDLGPTVEGLYGRQKFLVLYVATGAAGVAASYLWYPNSVSIGASGALFGLIGAMITYGYRNRRSIGDAVRNNFVRWAIYGLLFGFLMPGLDNAAHLGGLVAGMAFSLLVSDVPSLTSPAIAFWKVLQVAVVLLVALSFVMVALHPLNLGG